MSKKELIAGLWNGHDCSYCILDNMGNPIIHAELERYNREKSPSGDSVSFMKERSKHMFSNVKYFASSFPVKKLENYKKSMIDIQNQIKTNDGKLFYFPHHYCHAANAFYSSNFNDALIVTLDGGGSENEAAGESCCTVWSGINNNIIPIKSFSPNEINIGGVWSRVTRYVFNLQNGWPLGGQEGTVMAMAALGDPSKYVEDFMKMLTIDKVSAGFKPLNQPAGARVLGKDPKHPYLEKWFQIAESNDQERYNLAAGLQAATESLIRTVLKYAIQASGLKDMNICLVGGVTLNSVAMGKIKKWFPTMIKDIYIPPVPYDAGLSIGAAQIVHHSILGNPRKQWDNNFTSYMGELWPESAIDTAINKALTDTNNKIFSVEDCDDEKAINLLVNQKIVAIFNKESESGRRALGNRSILADPRSDKMKDNINKKVKHRQWFRPFAPSVLEEHAENWFENFIKSPYMQFVIPFKDDKKQKVPAVVHFDGTARLQTVTKEHNPWYYKFLSEWYKKTNVPMLLNTSFNDREPICENPSHAINCFLGTDIDCLYFPEFSKILLKEQK